MSTKLDAASETVSAGNDEVGFTHSDAEAGRDDYGGPQAMATTDLEPVRARSDDVIALAEEQLRVDKRTVEGQRVRVSSRTENVEQVLRESLRGEAVGVTRVPVDRVVAEGEAAPQVRNEGGVTIIPVVEEVLFVEKRLVLKEEIHIHRTASAEDVELPVTLRRQHAVIERLDPDGHPLDLPDLPTEETQRRPDGQTIHPASRTEVEIQDGRGAIDRSGTVDHRG